MAAPMFCFRADERTRTRLRRLAVETGKTCSDVLRTLVEHATLRPVVVQELVPVVLETESSVAPVSQAGRDAAYLEPTR